MPSEIAGDELDPSWRQALHYFLREGWVAGKDYVYTYGPLGALGTPTFDPGTFGFRVAWDVFFSFFAAITFCLWAAQLPGPRSQAFFLLLLWALPALWGGFVHTVMLTASLVILRKRGPPGIWAAVTLAVFAVLALIKVPFMILGGACGLAILAHAWRESGWKRAASLAALGLASLVAALLAARQPLAALPRLIGRSLGVAGGYAEAMAADFSTPGRVAAFAFLALMTIVLLLALLRRPLAWDTAVPAALVTLFLATAWKHGIVRLDAGHLLEFFTMAAILPFLLWPWAPAPPPWRRWMQHACLAAGLAAALVGTHLVMSSKRFDLPWPKWIGDASVSTVRTASQLVNLAGFYRERVSARAGLAKRFALPRTAEKVGRSTLDLIGNAQGVVLLNDFNWRPRPVFQSYVAYNAKLSRLNRDYFVNPGAPEYVLFDGRPLDRDLPTMGDGPALLEILRRYEAADMEKGYVLLRRRAEPLAAPNPQPLREAAVRFGQWFDVSALGESPKTLSIDLRRSLFGKLWAAAYKPPPVYLEVEFVEGGSAVYRIIPALMTDGVLLDPLPRDIQQWWLLVQGRALPRVRRIRVTTDAAGSRSFLSELRLVIGPATLPDEGASPAFPMLASSPISVTSARSDGVRPLVIEGQEVLLVHAPGEMRYQLEAGRYRLTGRYGVAPSGYIAGATNGVGFRALVEAGSTKRVLFERDLRPRDTLEDRGFQTLAVDFEVESPASLVLTTVTLGDGAWDYSFWTAIAIQRLAANEG